MPYFWRYRKGKPYRIKIPDGFTPGTTKEFGLKGVKWRGAFVVFKCMKCGRPIRGFQELGRHNSLYHQSRARR